MPPIIWLLLGLMLEEWLPIDLMLTMLLRAYDAISSFTCILDLARGFMKASTVRMPLFVTLVELNAASDIDL